MPSKPDSGTLCSAKQYLLCYERKVVRGSVMVEEWQPTWRCDGWWGMSGGAPARAPAPPRPARPGQHVGSGENSENSIIVGQHAPYWQYWVTYRTPHCPAWHGNTHSMMLSDNTDTRGSGCRKGLTAQEAKLYSMSFAWTPKIFGVVDSTIAINNLPPMFRQVASVVFTLPVLSSGILLCRAAALYQDEYQQ